jgi:formiminoglutamase
MTPHRPDGPPGWLEVTRGEAPLIVSLPHAGTMIPEREMAGFRSAWLARKDTDWHLERLYDFAAGLGATVLRTQLSRSVIDVNRDPSGASLYPGRPTTELCPTTTFDGEPLYAGSPPDAAEVARRRAAFFDPYHDALRAEIARLRALHPRIVLYDAHSIRSVIPRLFEGRLPVFNIGTDGGGACGCALTAAVGFLCAGTGQPTVVNGRFRGGWITRHHGAPRQGVHAIQMELACRAYMQEPPQPAPETWPAPYEEARAEPLRATLRAVLLACIGFAAQPEPARAAASR